MADSPILEFEDVSLRYGDNWALRNISLKLSPGETRIIFGAAGSGKTTLLKAVIGLVDVDEGRIKLFGKEVSEMREIDLFVLRSRAGVLFQEGGLFDSLSVGENVEYPLLNQKTNGSGPPSPRKSISGSVTRCALLNWNRPTANFPTRSQAVCAAGWALRAR